MRRDISKSVKDRFGGDISRRTNGHPIKATHILITADEVGDLGKRAKFNGRGYRPSKIFGFGISIVQSPERFAEITEMHKKRKNIKGEFKARKRSTFEKAVLAFKIRISGARTYGIYIDKMKDVPKEWIEQCGSDFQIRMLWHILNMMIPRIRSDKIIVIVDDEGLYHDKNGIDLVEAMSNDLSRNHGTDVRCRTVGEESDEYFPQMETNDLVARALYDRKESKSPWASVIMGQRIVRLGANDSIEKGDGL